MKMGPTVGPEIWVTKYQSRGLLGRLKKAPTAGPETPVTDFQSRGEFDPMKMGLTFGPRNLGNKLPIRRTALPPEEGTDSWSRNV